MGKAFKKILGWLIATSSLTVGTLGRKNIRIRKGEFAVVISRLKNNELLAAAEFCIKEADKHFNGAPLNIHIITYDESYGDICPDGVVYAMPQTDSFKWNERVDSSMGFKW